MSLPRDLEGWRGRHRGETVLVCGCGRSLAALSARPSCIVIGVNDVGRLIDPDYLVVLNPRQQFPPERFAHIAATRAKAVFTTVAGLGIAHAHQVRVGLGERGGVRIDRPGRLPYTRNSPYVAVALAMLMGARRIGLIGVDFTEGHFFGATGAHPLARELAQIDREYGRLAEAARAEGIEIVNLSQESRLTALPKQTVNAFVAAGAASASRAAPLRIVSYATTPVAGVPAILARCINSRTPHRARCVWARRDYGNGVCFQGDVEWLRQPRAAEEALREADAIIVHNGKVDPRHRAIVVGKPVITMAHNYLWNVDQQFVQRGLPGAVVGQYQATLPEFRDWSVVPNPLPWWEEAYEAAEKGPQVTICYTPSGRHECYPPGHRLFWHAKGYATTMAVLERLAKRFPVAIEAIRDRQVSHAEAIAMKRRAHITIDECVTGSYHRNSLEGLAAGSVVVNGVGLLPDVIEVFRRCCPDAGDLPFQPASLAELEGVLAELVGGGVAPLCEHGARNRAWMQRNWDFAWQWQRFWVPLIDQALERTEHPPMIAAITVPPQPTRTTPAPKAPEEESKAVSVVIPHGGRERLPQLAATLASLRQSAEARQIVVVDMGAEPAAERHCRSWEADHVFISHDGAFERARALNVGTGLARHGFILWLDNDLLVPPGFIAAAAAEMAARGLDYLIPYTAIRYLGQAESRAAMAGGCRPEDCRPAKILFSGRHVSGGAGLVRRDFVRRYGGLCEDFKGWGGEDNAWLHKARLLGRSGITTRHDQFLVHLFHAGSGAFEGAPRAGDNPHYGRNVSVLGEITRLRRADDLLRRLPPPAHASCPWPECKRLMFLCDGRNGSLSRRLADAAARGLTGLYGASIDRQLPQPKGTAPLVQAAPSYDGIVVFGRDGAADVARGARLPPDRVLAVDERGGPADPAELTRLASLAGVLSPDPALRHAVEERGGRAWRLSLNGEGAADELEAAIALAQPLSLLLNAPAAAPQGRALARGGHEPLPVWLYWEGDCPDWIRLCQGTIADHAPTARLLTPETFDALWDRDRDIDLARLCPAHRADFIRAFLLARHGGLWIDSDCIVMKPLQPLLDALQTTDFLAHRDRQNYVPNGFIGACRNSSIAADYYRRIAEILRSGRRLGWISLGGEPLTALLRDTRAPWRELPCHAIQPICWSNPAPFFEVGEPPAHEARLVDAAICYMLSNTSIRKLQAEHPNHNLLADGSFFRFLLDRSRAAARSRQKADAGASTTVQDPGYLPFAVQAIAELAPSRVLDASAKVGRWGTFVRELCGPATNCDPDVRIDGLVAEGSAVEDRHRPFYDSLERGDWPEEAPAQRWDLVILDDLLARWPHPRSDEVLSSALARAAYVLIKASINPAIMAGADHSAGMPLLDALALSPLRYELHTDSAGDTSGIFLLSLDDPKRMRASQANRSTFEAIVHSNRAVGIESVSGPGSSLAQTAEIRARLPLLLQDIGANSMLDAPCGDFHWMRQTALGLDRYIGVDIVPELIAENRHRYGSATRRFLCLDISQQLLPRTDVIFCRDCLVHFPIDMILATLRNFKRSGATYLLTTTFTAARDGADVRLGDWRPLNLQRPPFCFPPPLRLIIEKCTEAGGRYADKSLGLWNLSDLPL